ncbi:hypothetical protein Droror1_Dr00001623 [Drosera rotundifolia]
MAADSYETTRSLFKRIKSIDPENATKIMGYILIQDYGDSEMLRLALGPDSAILSLICQAKSHLGISSNTFSASPETTPSATSAWVGSGFGDYPLSPGAKGSLSYAAVVNGSWSNSSGGSQGLFNFNKNEGNLGYPVGVSPKSVDFGGQFGDLRARNGVGSDYFGWDEANSVGNGSHFHHRRSFSVNDVGFGGQDLGLGFGLKNPNACGQFMRDGFVHGDGFGESVESYGSGNLGGSCKFGEFEGYEEEMMRCRVAQQRRLATAQLIARANKLNALEIEAQRSAAAEALMMEEEFRRLSRSRMGRSEFSGMGGGDSSPASNQIYLTFPADSTFSDEDVANYFSLYGPVQDVRIPYQQKRMFGFVTFVYPETVKLILAKGNPHFVCDSRVLVKPYKEKAKMPDKKQHQQQQQFETNEFSSCLSPTRHVNRDSFNVQLGPRAMYNTHDMLQKRKLDQQADLQQALELQGRRLMSLQLMDLNSRPQSFRNISAGSPVSSLNCGVFHPSNGFGRDNMEEVKGSSAATPDGQLPEEVNAASIDSNGHKKEDGSNNDECDLHLPESLEHVLPDNLLSSPIKSTGESTFDITGVQVSASSNPDNDQLIPGTTSLCNARSKSLFLEIPRLSSGHEAIGM